MPKKNVKKVEDKEELVGEPDEFLDDDEHSDAHTEHELSVSAGQEDADIYSEEGRESLTESDELEPWEEAFSEGAEGSKKGVCANCNKVLGDNIVEQEYDDKLLRFCCAGCANSYQP